MLEKVGFFFRKISDFFFSCYIGVTSSPRFFGPHVGARFHAASHCWWIATSPISEGGRPSFLPCQSHAQFQTQPLLKTTVFVWLPDLWPHGWHDHDISMKWLINSCLYVICMQTSCELNYQLASFEVRWLGHFRPPSCFQYTAVELPLEDWSTEAVTRSLW